jgi:hypothetical protein
MAGGPIGRRGNGGDNRSSYRIQPRLPDSCEEVESFLPNAWPTGVRNLGCLACDAQFVSSGRHERLCASCRRHKAS